MLKMFGFNTKLSSEKSKSTSSNIAGSARSGDVHRSERHHLFVAIDIVISYTCEGPSDRDPLLQKYY